MPFAEFTLGTAEFSAEFAFGAVLGACGAFGTLCGALGTLGTAFGALGICGAFGTAEFVAFASKVGALGVAIFSATESLPAVLYI